MSRPKDLRNFLRKECLSAQLKCPADTTERNNASPSKPNLLGPKQGDSKPNNSACQSHDIDSVFGEELFSTGDSKSEELKRLVAEKEGEVTAPSSRHGDGQLETLRRELSIIVDAEFGASERERPLIARQKEALLREITWLETQQQVQKSPEFVKGNSRADLNTKLQSFPPPLTARELARIRKAELAKQHEACENVPSDPLAGAFVVTRRAPKKRKAKEPPIDEYLDGEDRYRLFGPPKEKRVKRKKSSAVVIEKPRSMIGRWRSEIHDYFPVINGKRGGYLGDIDRYERMALRRELAELGSHL